jgi:hypothetical protein
MTSLLDRGLGCSSSSIKHSNAPLGNLHYSIFVEKITLAQEIHPLVLDAKSYSYQALTSAAFSPYHGPGMEQQSSWTSVTGERHSFPRLGDQCFYPVPSSAQYMVPLPTVCPAPVAMRFQIPEPLTFTLASTQLDQQTMAGPNHSPLGSYEFDVYSSMNLGDQKSTKKTDHQSQEDGPVHYSYKPVWPVEANPFNPDFGVSWSNRPAIRGVNPERTFDHLNNDSFHQENLQEEYYPPPMSYYVSSADVFYPQPETSLQMTSEVSAPFGSNSWSPWFEQPTVTWRQS